MYHIMHTSTYNVCYIENADATPPHLNVFLRLGSSGDLLVFCSSSAMGSSVFYVCRLILDMVLRIFDVWRTSLESFWVCGGFKESSRNHL